MDDNKKELFRLVSGLSVCMKELTDCMQNLNAFLADMSKSLMPKPQTQGETPETSEEPIIVCNFCKNFIYGTLSLEQRTWFRSSAVAASFDKFVELNPVCVSDHLTKKDTQFFEDDLKEVLQMGCKKAITAIMCRGKEYLCGERGLWFVPKEEASEGYAGDALLSGETITLTTKSTIS